MSGRITDSGCGSNVTATGTQAAGCLGNSTVQEDAVPTMHTVERTDRDGGCREAGGDLVAPAPHMHGHTLPRRVHQRGILIGRLSGMAADDVTTSYAESGHDAPT